MYAKSRISFFVAFVIALWLPYTALPAVMGDDVEWDTVQQAPYFNYGDEAGKMHQVGLLACASR